MSDITRNPAASAHHLLFEARLALRRNAYDQSRSRAAAAAESFVKLGWPVEEAVIWLCGGRAAWWQVFLIALPAAAALAFLSWHLVERPMLRLKPRGRRTAAGYAPTPQQA